MEGYTEELVDFVDKATKQEPDERIPVSDLLQHEFLTKDIAE